MNPQQEDLQRRLQKIEVEIDSSGSGFSTLKSTLVQFLTWFNKLSTTPKLVVLGVAVIFGFAILQALLKLVAAVISLALLSLLVYVGYKFLVSNNQSNQ